jgi:hypothetical protein
MGTEMLSYNQLGDRLNCSPEAARALVKRLRLPRQKANDGKVLVSVDLSEINHKPMPVRSPADHHPIIASLKARIEVLQTELAKIEALASGHRADFERERERADALMAELLKVTAAAMAAKEAAARLEGGQVRLCQELSDVHSDRDAWRSEVERLILIEYRRNERVPAVVEAARRVGAQPPQDPPVCFDNVVRHDHQFLKFDFQPPREGGQAQ